MCNFLSCSYRLFKRMDWCCFIIGIMLLFLLVLIFEIFGILEFLSHMIIGIYENEHAANWVTAISAFFAAFCAFCAFRQSIEAQKNAAFNSLFAQLIENHKYIFSNGELKKTKKKDEAEIAKTVFESFFAHCSFVLGKNPRIISPDLIQKDIYGDFLGSLENSSHLSHCFKYVYYEIKTIIDEDSLTTRDRVHYMGIVQACMNYDELFCYFINLLQHFSRKKHWKKVDYEFMNEVKENNFFKNLVEGHDDKYKELIKQIYVGSSNGSHEIQKVIDKIMNKDLFMY